MIPPSFSDLGKAAKDIFDKNYKIGKVSLDVSTKSNEGVQLNMKGDHSTKDHKLSGSFETVYNFNNGLKSSLKWETNKKLLTSLSMENVLTNGTKLSGDCTFNPDSGEKSFKATSSYKTHSFNGSIIKDFKSLTPILTPSFVIGCTNSRPYYLGGELTLDPTKIDFTKNKLAIGYQTKDLAIIASVQNLTNVESLIYQKVNKDIEVGVQVKWNRDSRESDFAFGGKYYLANDSFVKAKINAASKLGLAYGFKVKDNVSISLSADLDGKAPETGPHRFGMEISYSP